jgi:hypothetical protein
MVPSTPTIFNVAFIFSKEDLVKCQQADGSLTFYCKILTHVKRVASGNFPAGLAISCTTELYIIYSTRRIIRQNAVQ